MNNIQNITTILIFLISVLLLVSIVSTIIDSIRYKKRIRKDREEIDKLFNASLRKLEQSKKASNAKVKSRKKS